MPSRRKRGARRTSPIPGEQEAEQQQQSGSEPRSGTPSDKEVDLQHEHTTTPPPPSPPVCLNESSLSVLLDEEDSYRVVWEHDQHLARIRAYTDFFDTLAVLRRAAHGGDGESPQRRRQRAVDAAGAVKSPPPHALSGDRTPTDNGDRTRRSESAQFTPFTSMDRELILASHTPQGAYASGNGYGWGEAYGSGAGADSQTAVLLRLEAERQRLAQELLESQTQVQQLQTSLREAHKTNPDGAAAYESHRHGGPRPPLRPPPASNGSLSSLTNSLSRAHSKTPPSEPFGEPTTVSVTQQMRQMDAAHDEDDDVVMRRTTMQFVQPLRQPQYPRRPSPSPSPSRGGNGSLVAAGPPLPPPAAAAGQRPIDVADFFWTLRVAPPPSELHEEQCGHADHCPVTPNLSMAQEGGRGYRNYGAIPASAARRDEQSVALTCESAWVDSGFYCYNILEEMSCLRVVRSWDDVTMAQAGAAQDGRPMTEKEVTRVLLDRTPATTPSTQSLQLPSSRTPVVDVSGGGAMLWPATTAVGSDGVAMFVGGAAPSAAHDSSALAQGYRLPYLQRLWVTAVLRQYILFLLVTITCVHLLIPTMLIGTINVFEAAGGDDFYATKNRFGRSALLVVARLGSSSLVFLFFFCFVCAEGGRRHASAVAAAAAESAAASSDHIASPVRNASVSDSVSSHASPSPNTRTPSRFQRIRHAPVGALVHAVMCLGAAVCFVGALFFNRSCEARSLPLALLGMALYGAGEALLIGGIGTIVSAEIGVVAGVNVSLLLLLSNWLLVNAFGAFVLPKLTYYIYNPSQVLQSQVYSTATIGAYVFALLMLCPRDLIERAAHAHAPFVSPRKLLSAARHDVSICFYFRALTVALLTGAVVLIMAACSAIFVPHQAEAASMSESARTKELMGTGSGKRGTANTASDAGFIAASMDRWLSQQRHAPVYLFAAALLFVPLCFIPRLAALVNRWCPIALMTTLLCLLWAVSTASSWATVLGLTSSGLPSSDGSKSSGGGGGNDGMEKVTGWLWWAWMWIGEHHVLTPSMFVTGMVTGMIYTIVTSSLLRSIANAGVQLPVLHPAQWRMAFHEHDRCRDEKLMMRQQQRVKDSFSSSSGIALNEASPLVPGSGGRRSGEASAADVGALAEAEAEVEVPTTAAAVQDAAVQDMEERMRSVRMQLRGGPAVMMVLAALLIMLVLLASVVVAMVAAVLLTDRSETPVYVTAVLPGVSWDEHLLLKTVVTGVLAVAMVVQWVEVFHRVCCSCCC